MNIKILLYCLAIPFSMAALNSININNIFKKNKYYEARILYIFLTISLSYLVVNFFYDFYLNFRLF